MVTKSWMFCPFFSPETEMTGRHGVYCGEGSISSTFTGKHPSLREPFSRGYSRTHHCRLQILARCTKAQKQPQLNLNKFASRTLPLDIFPGGTTTFREQPWEYVTKFFSFFLHPKCPTRVCEHIQCQHEFFLALCNDS